MFKVNNKDTRTTIFLLWAYFTPCSSVSVVNFEHVAAEQDSSLYRNSRAEMSEKNVVLKNFANFTGKRLCQSPFFIKVAGPGTLFKKRLWQRFYKIFSTPFLRNTLSGYFCV